ncbi:adenine deaminase [Solibacillus sp. FSL H8-0538]|uniref:adenine deaminase n=1 Tax=Solibacillus sp. FSL H8-0538 TaxID=2921400 RepID=UPI0030FA223C
MKRRIEISQKRIKADFILKNAQVADVFNLRWRLADIVVADGRIIAIDERGEFEAYEVEDAGGRYVIPGLIDAHIHIESSMLTPSEFNRIMLPHGITSVVTDPHEIANVSGTAGLQFMLDDAATAEMDIYFMLPSSVPGTSFEHAGAVLEATDLAAFEGHAAVLGLAEVMDFPAVLNGEHNMLAKIEFAQKAGMVIDGHCAGLTSNQIRGYRAAGIQTDHECVTADEARDRIEQGMYVFIREGSAAKNLKSLLPAVTAANARRFAFCTDDKHLDELMEQGSINYAVSLAIKEGMEPLQAIQLASLNVAECYQLKDKGALASGFIADFVMVEDLQTMKVSTVWKNGMKVTENGQMLSAPTPKIDIMPAITASVHLPKLTKDDLAILFTHGDRANVIEIMPDQLTTKRIECTVDVVEGQFVPSIEKDLLKLAVIERHHQLGTKGVAIVHGFGLQRGAVATTVAHDSHNAIVVGTNDADMLVALEALQKMQGGLVVVADGQVLEEFALPIAGLMTDLQANVAAKSLLNVHEALQQIHPDLHFHFFLTLSFLSLPVIPDIKLTDTGLFDVTQFQHISVEIID